MMYVPNINKYNLIFTTLKMTITVMCNIHVFFDSITLNKW